MILRMLLKHFVFAILLVATGGFALIVSGELDNGQKGFISIDCGLPQNSNYTERETGLNYISDDPFIDEDTGESTFLSSTYRHEYQQQMWYVRSFPRGIRNCYTINVTSGTKYLIGTSFLYGNYDDKDTPPKFDLYLGANLWDTVDVTDADDAVGFEIVHVPPQNHIHLCLVKTGSWTPFISVIRLRPLNNTYYKTEMGSLALVARLDIGNTDEYGYRYPVDVHDRYWSPYLSEDWTRLNSSSSSNIDYVDNDQPPSEVMSTAATPKYPRDTLEYWLPSNNTCEYYVYMHFAELELLKDDQLREFKISYNEEEWTREPLTPSNLSTTSLFSTTAILGGHAFSLYATDNSTLPPILNAIEVYMVKQFLESEADHNDAEAVTIIKTTYGVKRNWQGDPCTRGYLWEGLNCSYNGYEPPRIISLNLSSSELTGEIPPSISNLLMMENLDLSNNYFTGSVPDFLSQLPNLRILNLENNSLSGSIPNALIKKSNQNILSLSVCGNQDLIAPVSCNSKNLMKKKKNSLVIPVAASAVGIFVVLATVVAIWWVLKRKRQHNIAKSSIQKGTVESGKQQYTYPDILRITNNFEHVLGKGGFGSVYHGHIGDTQVAVKVPSPLAVRGREQFLAEVNLLMRVHHRNLTKLVGYCNDGTKALIYEYMANGNLQEHLSDVDSCLYILKWEVRVQIALHAAQGLEYLHYGCRPPIVHRDVKPTNILLNENLQAKLSDFGLSKTFPTDVSNGSHISSVIGGTPGYLDPVYYISNRLNEKSDVFSFGVVLLQIVTGRPAIDKSNHNIHISQWVTNLLVNGDIKSIVDPRLQGNFDINSAWKAVELAINCVSHKSTHRPTMGQVVIELKQCLDSCTRKFDKELAWSRERKVIESKNSIEAKPLNSITNMSPPPR